MIDTVESPSHAATGGAMPVRRGRFSALRRALRELGLIVVGVFIALSADSWWGNRQEAELGRTYLDQLRSDLTQNRAILSAAILEDSIHADAAHRFDRGLHTRTVVPGDSIRAWMAADPVWYSDPRVLLGTVNTLIATGDIRLIGEGPRRAAVVAYASAMQSDLDELGRYLELQMSYMRGFYLRAEVAGVPVFVRSAPEPGGWSGELLDDLVRAWPVLQGDPEIRAAIGGLGIAKENRLFYLKRMLSETDQLLSKLE
jgi:hypothetical protein